MCVRLTQAYFRRQSACAVDAERTQKTLKTRKQTLVRFYAAETTEYFVGFPSSV